MGGHARQTDSGFINHGGGRQVRGNKGANKEKKTQGHTVADGATNDRKMKCRSRKRGEKNKGKREKSRFGPHARQLCKLKVCCFSCSP